MAEELAAKADRSVNARIAKARFPTIRTLEAFDFSYQPDLPVALIKELARLEFLGKAENVIVIMVGPPGTGKSHLATALALKACEARKRVLFTCVPTLLDQLVAATVDRSLGRRLHDLGKLDLLLTDELGYLPMDPQRASLFFQLVSNRYERGSIIITTNKPFEQWGQVFGGDGRPRPHYLLRVRRRGEPDRAHGRPRTRHRVRIRRPQPAHPRRALGRRDPRGRCRLHLR